MLFLHKWWFINLSNLRYIGRFPAKVRSFWVVYIVSLAHSVQYTISSNSLFLQGMPLQLAIKKHVIHKRCQSPQAFFTNDMKWMNEKKKTKSPEISRIYLIFLYFACSCFFFINYCSFVGFRVKQKKTPYEKKNEFEENVHRSSSCQFIDAKQLCQQSIFSMLLFHLQHRFALEIVE